MSQDMFPVAILAGGLATRLSPLSNSLPKSMIDIEGKPFIAHQLSLLKANQVSKVVVCAGYLADMIQGFVATGERFGLKVLFSLDGPQLRGTAGAIKQALPLLGEHFFVLYGDSYLLCNFCDVQTAYQKSRKLGLMTVFQNEGRWDRSNVEFLDGRILAYDKRRQTPKMKHIDYGLGVFHYSAFQSLAPNRRTDLDSVCRALLSRSELAAYEVSERFYEVGSFEGLEETRRFLAGIAGH